MRLITPVLAGAVSLAFLVPAASGAQAADKYVGKATNTDGSMSYGKVTFTVKGSKIKNFKVELATVGNGGCGGFKSVIVPVMKLRGTRMSGAYQAVKNLDDIVTVHGTLSGGKAKGIFSEGPLCQVDGRFTASKR